MPEITKQVGEHFTFAVDFTPKLPANSALVSGKLFATRRGKTNSTTLTAPATPGATTLTVADDVQDGAELILNVGESTEEPLLVLSTAGVGPFVATLASAVQLSHAAGASIKYDPGASELVLASTTATISGALMKANVIGGLVYLYTVTFLATLTTGEVLRQDVSLIIQD